MNNRAYHLKKKFGITEEQYADALQKQDGSCAVCKRPAGVFKTRLAVDHCHKTGQIRGLLCIHCNRYVIGRYTRESLGLLRSACAYLEREYTGLVVPPKKKKRRRKCKRGRKKRLKDG